MFAIRVTVNNGRRYKRMEHVGSTALKHDTMPLIPPGLDSGYSTKLWLRWWLPALAGIFRMSGAAVKRRWMRDVVAGPVAASHYREQVRCDWAAAAAAAVAGTDRPSVKSVCPARKPTVPGSDSVRCRQTSYCVWGTVIRHWTFTIYSRSMPPSGETAEGIRKN